MLSLTGCKRSSTKRQVKIDDDPVGLMTMVHAADDRASAQLVRGFHSIEQNAWRWTAGSFMITLKTPAGSAQKGATLTFKLRGAGVTLNKVGPVTLNASVNGHALAPETYSKTGEYTYSRDVPASALAAMPSTWTSSSISSWPAGVEEQRELGLIMVMIGFEAKP
jgi:hypothetical protein